MSLEFILLTHRKGPTRKQEIFKNYEKVKKGPTLNKKHGETAVKSMLLIMTRVRNVE